MISLYTFNAILDTFVIGTHHTKHKSSNRCVFLHNQTFTHTLYIYIGLTASHRYRIILLEMMCAPDEISPFYDNKTFLP